MNGSELSLNILIETWDLESILGLIAIHALPNQGNHWLLDPGGNFMVCIWWFFFFLNFKQVVKGINTNTSNIKIGLPNQHWPIFSNSVSSRLSPWFMATWTSAYACRMAAYFAFIASAFLSAASDTTSDGDVFFAMESSVLRAPQARSWIGDTCGNCVMNISLKGKQMFS